MQQKGTFGAVPVCLGNLALGGFKPMLPCHPDAGCRGKAHFPVGKLIPVAPKPQNGISAAGQARAALVGNPSEPEPIAPSLPYPGKAVTVLVGGSHGQHHTALSSPWMASIRMTAAGSICHFSASLRISSAAGPALMTTLARRS